MRYCKEWLTKWKIGSWRWFLDHSLVHWGEAKVACDGMQVWGCEALRDLRIMTEIRQGPFVQDNSFSWLTSCSSKNWFRQLFEVAHHLSNSWPSYIRWHAFWLEYILSEDTEPDMIITSFAKVFDYKITSSFDLLVASRPHSFLKTPTYFHLTTERKKRYFF